VLDEGDEATRAGDAGVAVAVEGFADVDAVVAEEVGF
jgi:hypothetical protein